MHHDSLDRWRHDHVFGQDRARAGEKRTLIVILVTATMMVAEIAAGIAFGSMALLADGLHMGSHAVALGIAYFAYVYARRHARDERFAFGTGKVNALGGFTGAVLLGVFAAMMAWESVHRLLEPVPIRFNWAIAVAVIGLVVNAASAVILSAGGEGGSEFDHGHDHGHSHGHSHGGGGSGGGDSGGGGEDHNLRSAYLHVLADALTSVLAIAALLAGKYVGWNWLDPVMGIVGAVLVAVWALGLLRSTSGVLLDHQQTGELRDAVYASIEGATDDRISDLHLWSIGPGIYAGEIALVTHDEHDAAHYKRKIPDGLGIVHLTVEVHRCRHVDGPDHATSAAAHPPHHHDHDHDHDHAHDHDHHHDHAGH